MADDKLNVGINFNVTGNADASSALRALGTAAAETAAEFDAAAVSAKAMADAVTAAQLLSQLGIKASAAGGVSEGGAGLVTVAQEEQANAQAILNSANLQAVAVTKAEAAATMEAAAAASEAAAAKRAEAVATDATVAASTEGAVAAERLAAADAEVAGAARAAGASSEAMAAEAGGATAIFGGMWTQIIAVVAALEAYNKAKEFISAGFAFNQAIESARLGIAASVNAMASLTDAQGRALEGQQKFGAATAIADDQIQKLFADSARTSTTVQQLVTTYQSLIAVGINAGASLDQVRRITTDAALAAGALNIPYSQLSVTLVQLLEGHTRVTNRLSQALGITQADLRVWKEKGTLVDEITDRLAQYESLSSRIQGTWAGIKSNITEFFQQFTGAATSGAFTTLETGLKGQLGRVFDFDTGKLKSDVQGASDLVRDGLGGAAQLVVELVQHIVNGLEAMGQWYDTNREKAQALGRDMLALVENTAKIVAGIVNIGVQVVAWAAESLVVQTIFRTISDVVGFIADHLGTITAIVAGVATIANLAWFDTAIPAAIAFVAALNPITAIIGIVIAITAAVEAHTIAQERAAAAAIAHRQAMIEQAGSTASLVAQYEALGRQIDNGRLSTQELKTAKAQLKTVTEELVKLSPAYRDALSNENDSLEVQLAKVQAVNDAQIALLATKRDAALAEEQALTAQDVALEAKIAKLKQSGLGTIGGQFALVGAEKDLADVKTRLDAAHAEFGGYVQAIEKADQGRGDGLAIVKKKGGGDTPKPEKGLDETEANAAIERMNAQAATIKQSLDVQLARNELSYADYFAKLNAIELTALDVAIAEKTKLLAKTNDPKEQAKLGADIAKLKEEETQAVEKNKQKQNQLEAAYDKQRTTIAIEALKEEGEQALAYELEWAEKHNAQLARALAEGDQATIDALNREHDIGIAQNRAKDLATRAQGATSAAGGEVQSIKDQVQERAISEARGRELIIAAYQREAFAIQHALDAARALAALSPTAENISKVDALAKQYAGVQKAIVQTQRASEQLKYEIAGALANDFTQFFTQTIANAHSVGEAFRSLAASVVQSLEQIIAKLIEAQIEGALLKALGVGGGGGFSLATVANAGISHAAGGGHVFGPGGPTEDRVPAMLSAGEYVVRASAVDQMGVGFFDAVNAGSLRMTPHASGGLARYAEGGMVGAWGAGHYARGGAVGSAPGAAPGAAGSEKSHLHVSLEPGLIAEFMRSPEGHKVTLETLARNPKSARQALRVG